MKVRPTRLRPFGLGKKLVGGFCFSLFFLFLAIVVPLWPISAPLFIFLAIGAPFAYLGYRASGVCPCCYEKLEVTKRYGGWKCKGCKSPLYIQNNKLYRI